MAYDKNALKQELMADPESLGYADHFFTFTVDGFERTQLGDAQAIAAKLNAPHSKVDIDLDNLTANQVFLAIDPAEWEALSQPRRDWLDLFLSQSPISIQHPTAKTWFDAAFPAGSETRKSLRALLRRKGSRAEQLFGVGCVVSYSQIGEAFNA